MKTKSQEIDALRQLAQSLGPNSYCGPWLLANLPRIEADIRSDFPPCPSWEGSRRDAQEILAEAKREADQILVRARKQSDDLIARTSATLAAERGRLRELLQQALNRI